MNCPYKGKLKLLKKDSQLIQAIYEDVKRNFADVNSLKFNIELINKIANEIEDYHKYKLGKKKIDKIDLFFKIYETIYGQLNDKDKMQIVDTLTFLNDNKKIKPRKIIRFLFDILKNVFFKA